MTISGPSPLNYSINSQTPFKVVANPRAPSTGDYKNFREGDEWLDTSSYDWWKLAQLNGPSALWVKLGGTGAQVESFIPDSGTSPVIPNASNEITMTGGDTIEVIGSLNTLTFETKAGGYPITRFVVGPAGQAGYQTIASAITAAALAGSRSVYIMPGTYTENLTLVNGVNLIGTGFNICTIVGQHTPPSSGTFLAQNLTFTTATDVFETGSAGTCAITCDDCIFNISNGYVFDLQLWSGALTLLRCTSIGTQDGVVNNTSGSVVNITDSKLGAGTSNSMVLGGTVNFNGSTFSCVTICNANTNLTADDCQFFNRISLLSNTIALISNSRISSGVLACILQSSSGAVTLSNLSLNSSNVNALDGAGAGVVQLNDIIFLNSIGIAGTLTLTGGTLVGGTHIAANNNAYDLGTTSKAWRNAYVKGVTWDNGTNILNGYKALTSFTPTLTFGGGSTGITYSTRTGTYMRIGNMVQINISLVLTSKGSSTGIAIVGGLPYDSFTETACSIVWDFITLTGGYTQVVANTPAVGSSDLTISLYETGSGVGRNSLLNSQFANNTTLFLSLNYFTQDSF